MSDKAEMDELWQALAREAGTAAEQMAIGATALSKVSYAQQAHYGQAFFALSIGFERTAKLAFVVDHALENGGAFPSHNALRKQGHNLSELLEIADDIAGRRGMAAEGIQLPRTLIHSGIVQVLSDFASNITRYYNLDLITSDPRSSKLVSPVHAWYNLVTVPILEKHYGLHHQDRHRRNAEVVDALLGPNSTVQFHSERGDRIETIYEASLQTGITEFARPYARMYVLQLTRFLGRLLSELGYAAHEVKLDVIPEMSDFFAIFNNSDSYFRKRKTWSIYRP